MAMRNRPIRPDAASGHPSHEREKGWETPEIARHEPQTAGLRGRARRVVVCEDRRGSESLIAPALQREGIETVTCLDGAALLEEVMRGPPDVVIYLLRPGNEQDLGVLELLRRAAPAVPLVLVALEGSLDTQKLVQGLRPIYYAVWPVEGPELRDAVEAALLRRGHHCL